MSPSEGPLRRPSGEATPSSGRAEPPVLIGLVHVLASPLAETAEYLSNMLVAYIPHSALVIFPRDCVGRPQTMFGEDAIVTRATFAELDDVRTSLTSGKVQRVAFTVGGKMRPVLATLADTGALLMLTDPGPVTPPALPGDVGAALHGLDDLVLQIWQVVALRFHQRATGGSPSYLLESRAALRAREEAVAELDDSHATTLETLLVTLRSSSLDDRTARQTATDLAAAAMVRLRTVTDRVRTISEEPVNTAFGRLRDDLRPLVKYGDIDVQFIEPPVDGRALPGEVAHGARAVVRGAILSLVGQRDISRVRVQWDCDGKNLLINIRDDGPGDLSVVSAQLQAIQQRVDALNGQLAMTATEGWGSEMSVAMPLDPPPALNKDALAWDLAPRELEVLERLAVGRRNREIARELGISENTVKFHVSRIFRKLGVTSRAQAAAVVLEMRIPSRR